MAAVFRPWESENSETVDMVEESQNVEEVVPESVQNDRVQVPGVYGLSPSLSLLSDGRTSSSLSESQPGTSMMDLSPHYCGPAAAPEWGNFAAMCAASHYQPVYATPYVQPVYATPYVQPTYGWLQANMQEEIHRLSHEDEAAKKKKKDRPKKYICEACNQAFSNNGQLKGHARIHTGERPFSCDFDGCEKAFTRNEELTRHKRIHTGEKPFDCPVCNKKFGRKDHLKKHTRTHENRTAYPLAGYPFQYQLPTANLPYVYKL